MILIAILRGVSEREWSRANPAGTRVQFNEYFRNLSAEELQVRWTPISQNRTNFELQKLAERVEAEPAVSRPPPKKRQRTHA